jgi:hypothetical protein
LPPEHVYVNGQDGHSTVVPQLSTLPQVPLAQSAASVWTTHWQAPGGLPFASQTTHVESGESPQQPYPSGFSAVAAEHWETPWQYPFGLNVLPQLVAPGGRQTVNVPVPPASEPHCA